MKCITYVSKVVARKNSAVIPVGFANMFSAARKKNAELQITGLISCRSGYYIQHLEGDNNIVDQLFSKIKSDSRHHQVTVLFEFEIAQRSFPEWNMKLVATANEDASFLKFMDQNSGKISSLDNTQRQLLGIFYGLKSSSPNSRRSYEGKSLMLLAWPDLMLLRQSPTVIKLCAQLTAQPYPYNSLLESRRFGTQRQLDKILQKFETLEILSVTDSLKQNIPVNRVGSSTRFYSKMKTFLGLR
ncbi:MAG: BLUF domain-containing protein [Arenicella sp.]|nr:BLUF domain-containing protein [Arenicella sp.]